MIIYLSLFRIYITINVYLKRPNISKIALRYKLTTNTSLQAMLRFKKKSNFGFERYVYYLNQFLLHFSTNWHYQQMDFCKYKVYMILTIIAILIKFYVIFIYLIKQGKLM